MWWSLDDDASAWFSVGQELDGHQDHFGRLVERLFPEGLGIGWLSYTFHHVQRPRVGHELDGNLEEGRQ